MRKLLYIFLILSTFNKSFSQELFGQKNTVEITQEWFFDHSEFKEPERKETKIFDRKGRLIKDIEFGFHHNVNLKLIGNIRSFEFQKNKLISEKTYASGTAFENNQVQFYWNYFYVNSRLKQINSNHSDYLFTYNNKKKTIEWTVTTDWDSISRKYYSKYDNNKEIVATGEYGNWSKNYIRKNDTLKIIEYSFDFPKKGDTTKTYITEVYSKNKIIYRKENGFGINTKKHSYSENGDLMTIFTRIFDEEQKDFKAELDYYKNGLIRQICKYEFIKKAWILKQRTEFIINGKLSTLNKKETKNINDILINGNKNWLQQWL
ncbi:hypothetical protein [Flagellimonas meishanensis]|uniref:hypothetical protein n=1 Tax=Flagellimonas meishanensis TaxID=2873264 RepID=UPI001CA6E5AB|nr:hypothetical protein [[Muricauda] meishanensis]